MARSSNSNPFENKTVYHSALVAAGEVEITMTQNEESPSKFDKSKYIIGFKYDGQEHFYQTENERCGKALAGYKGKTITVVASGRGDDADVEVLGETEGGGEERGRGRESERAPASSSRRESERGRSQERQPAERSGRQQETRGQEQPRRTAEEREADEAKAFKKARYQAAKCAVLMGIAFKASEAALEEQFGPDAFKADVSLEDIRAVAVTIFIELSRSTDITKLPVVMPEPPAPKQQEQRREPEREERREEPARQREEPAREERQAPRKTQPDPDADAPEDDIPF